MPVNCEDNTKLLITFFKDIPLHRQKITVWLPANLRNTDEDCIIYESILMMILAIRFIHYPAGGRRQTVRRSFAVPEASNNRLAGGTEWGPAGWWQ